MPVERSSNSRPALCGSGLKQLVAQVSRGTRHRTTRRADEHRDSTSTWSERPAGCANSEEAPGIGSSSGSGSNGDLAKTTGGTKAIGGEPVAMQELHEEVEPSRKRGGGDTDDQLAKKVKADTIPHFRIHDVAEEHLLAASDSDDDHSKRELDNAWWHEVDCQIEADLN